MNEYTPEQQRQHRRMLTAKLRSGSVRQGVDLLRTDPADATEFQEGCCLGVGCEVMRETTDRGVWEFRGGAWYFVVDDLRNSGVLPGPVREFFGFASNNGNIPGDEGLTDLNDSHMTFEYIADVIDEEPKGLIALS